MSHFLELLAAFFRLKKAFPERDSFTAAELFAEAGIKL